MARKLSHIGKPTPKTKTKFKAYRCIGGPYATWSIKLSSMDGRSATFRVGDWHGYYYASAGPSVKWVDVL
jgi:hypothetical protein